MLGLNGHMQIVRELRDILRVGGVSLSADGASLAPQAARDSSITRVRMRESVRFMRIGLLKKSFGRL